MKKIVGLVVLLLGISYLIFVVAGDDEEKGGKYNQKVVKESLTLEVTSNGGSAEIRYFTGQIKTQNGFVSTPWTKTVLTETAKVTASPGKGSSRVSCRIVSASSGKILDSDSGSKTAVCSYSTF